MHGSMIDTKKIVTVNNVGKRERGNSTESKSENDDLTG